MFRDEQGILELTLDDLIDKERESGLRCGPFERRLLVERAPERARRYLQKAREFPGIVNMPASGFTGPGEGQPVANPASFTAVATTTTETNLWVPAIWTPIPANTMYAGKLYKVSFGGIFSTSSAAPTAQWRPASGQNNSVAPTNVNLGISTAVTMTASLASVPFYGEFTLAIRALGLAASGASGTGNGFVGIGDITTAVGKLQLMGGTVASTIDNTTNGGLPISLIWSASNASNTCTCQWAFLRSLN